MFELTWPAFALLGAGLLFVILEVFFPSGGLLGFGAAVCLVLGGYAAYRTGAGDAVLGYVVLVVLLAPAAAAAAFKILPMTPLGKAVILSGTAMENRSATEEGLGELLGQRGKAVSPLRPAGIALIADRRVDVVTRGEAIDSGATIEVVKVEGNRVVVERSA